MILKLDDSERRTFSALAGAGFNSTLNDFASELEHLAKLGPGSFDELLDKYPDYFDTAVRILCNYNHFLQHVNALCEKYDQETELTNFYKEKLDEIAIICNSIKANRNFSQLHFS